MSVSWIMALILVAACAAGWILCLASRTIGSSVVLFPACRLPDRDNLRQNSSDTPARPEGDDAMPGSNGRSRPQRPDRKEAALRASRTLNPRPQDVTDEQFAGGGFFDARDVTQVKYEMVRKNRAGGASVTAAAAAFGLSRQSFYQAAAALDGGGLAALVPGRPGPKGGHKLTGEVIAWITGRKAASPALTAVQLAALVEEQFGIRVHPRSVQRVLARSKSGG
jgi:transposase